MSLSEQEKRMLREIEQSLMADDPKFGSAVAGLHAPSSGLSLRGVAIGLVGLVLLVGGVALSQNSLWFVALSVVGFFVMFGAGLWMLNKGGSGSAAPSASRSRRPVAGVNHDASGITSRMEDDFRRRFDGGNTP